jgi:hypothetical protein
MRACVAWAREYHVRLDRVAGDPLTLDPDQSAPRVNVDHIDAQAIPFVVTFTWA